ncbi:Ribonucleases P/MRP protein subunit pop1 [Golovinomyces cichoracearum]|uniref:Ribonucleases P/MRP protein subunit pop1 n=1 Tax=Golovinomyces cichoracearum TaxID=62708 RepID=A0A420J1J0_9PEZI|nr:Ribonucleases P/MRP protein subunit pop1 [Golovinomyces cichoracearum]
MALNTPTVPSGTKRPRNSTQISSAGAKHKGGKKDGKFVKKIDARTIVTQTAEAALKNGQLDVEAFLRSREFEIKALQNGMQKAKKNLSTKALQKVPRDMRRRTASHNVKRLPRRLQARAAKEMRDGNTPTVTANKRKPRSSRGHLRAETSKKLALLASKKRASKNVDGKSSGILTRAPRPKLRDNELNQPPKPKSKFRKRQIHKNWLPTHIWHAKRSKMTEPKHPLWKFAVPITPTDKSYRPTHRAGGVRGAIIWDMSYMSSICLEGSQSGLETFLKKVGLSEPWLWEEKGLKWRDGKRSWNGWLSKCIRDKSRLICPSTIIWCPKESNSENDVAAKKLSKVSKRRVLVRIHPAAFLEVWTEFLRLSKAQHPMIHIQDLRFEIGSIDATGPGSTEALLGILFPYCQPGMSIQAHAKTFSSLAGLTNPATLPPGAILSFAIMDPRLRYPPRTVKLPASTDEESNHNLLKLLSEWPIDTSTNTNSIFDRDSRFKATQLPSQKSVNRRKGLAPPGSYPPITANDPPIPIVLIATRSNSSKSSQGTWTILAPWKCILPIWYGLVHYPLSSGGNPRFGGLQELRQIHFEHGEPFFPTDYLGTNSGLSWELDERQKRKSDWDKRPKGKRVEWDSLDLGNNRIGEIGQGWSCDFELLLNQQSTLDEKKCIVQEDQIRSQAPLLEFLQTRDFRNLLLNKSVSPPPLNTVTTVRITFVGRGVAKSCARIYRLPQPQTKPNSTSPNNSSPSISMLRDQWLSLMPHTSKSKKTLHLKPKNANEMKRIPIGTPLPERVRLLAESLLQEPPIKYSDTKKHNGIDHPVVPDIDDVIGFITTGEYCLANGKGTAIGNILVCKILETFHHQKTNDQHTKSLCIIRNSGENFGRLATWEPV